MEKLRKLPGLRDLNERSWFALMQAYETLTTLFSSRGYRVIDTPILEPTELFVRKGGGEMAAQMYSFTDPGGNLVSLRPEFTSSIVRSCIEEGQLPILPLRAQYGGPVFRYRGDHEHYRQFHQAGVELLGSGHPRADSEILALASQGLSALGIGNVQLVLGDLGVYNELTGYLGLSERARVFVLSNVGQLKQGIKGLEAVQDKARKFRLLSNGSPTDSVLAQIDDLKEDQARDLIAGMIGQEEPGSLGQRSPEEVAERLLNKVRGTEDRAKVTRALELASRLASIEGDPQTSLTKAETLLSSEGINSRALARFREVVDLLDGEEVCGTSVRIDFGMARGIAYYTSMVFELVDAQSGGSFGGGGRYDDLGRAMGSDHDLPALGFAYDMEQLLAKLARPSTVAKGPAGQPGTLVVPGTPEAFVRARDVAAELRKGDAPIEMEVCGRNFEESLAYARAKAIETVVEVSNSGERKTHTVGIQ